MGWTPLNSMCGVRQFASSDVLQRSQKSDTLNFNHLASPWGIECSHVQIQARDHRDQMRPWGHTCFIAELYFIALSPALYLFIYEGLCCISRDATCRSDVSWEALRSWVPYKMLRTIHAYMWLHTDIDSTDMYPASMGACRIGEYKFRLGHAWTILSHSPSAPWCLQPWWGHLYSAFPAMSPWCLSFQRNILTYPSVRSIHSATSYSSKASLCPAESVLTVSLPPGFTFRIQFSFLLSSYLTDSIQISVRHTNSKQTRRHFPH